MLKCFLKLRKLCDDTHWTTISQSINEKISENFENNDLNDCCSKLQKCLGHIGNNNWRQAIESIYSKPRVASTVINKHFRNEMKDPRNLDRI